MLGRARKAPRDGFEGPRLTIYTRVACVDHWFHACHQSNNNPDLDTRRRRVVITRRAAAIRTVSPKAKMTRPAGEPEAVLRVWGARAKNRTILALWFCQSVALDYTRDTIAGDLMASSANLVTIWQSLLGLYQTAGW